MFHELFNNPQRIEPGRLQAEARKRFPAMVQSSHLQHYVVGDPIPSPIGKNNVFVGVATYSPADLRLLDTIDSLHSQWESMWNIAVFDFMECKNMSDVQRFVHQNHVIAQTPLVSVWLGGSRSFVATGLHDVYETLKKCGILS